MKEYEQLLSLEGDIPTRSGTYTYLSGRSRRQADICLNHPDIQSMMTPETIIVGQNICPFDVGMIKGEGLDLDYSAHRYFDAASIVFQSTPVIHSAT